MEFSLKDIKQDFPILHNSDLVYLDSASTTQKPQVVLDHINSMYSEANANVHRALYSLGSVATERYENSRKKVSSFIGANSDKEIIFTSGTTESINLLAHTLTDKLKNLSQKKKYKTKKFWEKNGIFFKNNYNENVLLRLVIPDLEEKQFFLVTKNFDVILDWNRSNYFALTVFLLSDEVVK